MICFFKKKIEKKTGLVILAGVFFIAVFVIFFGYKNLEFSESYSPPTFLFRTFTQKNFLFPKTENVKKFVSKEEFKNYLKERVLLESLYDFNFGAREEKFLAQGFAPKTLMPSITEEMVGLPERISETTVQVPGIDEPDIVKTDGKKIYFSPGRIWPFWRGPIITEKTIPPYPNQEPKTKVITAFPPEDLKLDSEIEKSGDLLLTGKTLVIFSERDIFGYDVSDHKKPEKKWEIKLEGNNSIVTSRLYKNKIYLVTKNLIDEAHPCPIKPLTIKGKTLEVGCSEIYHPMVSVPVDVTFLVMVLNPLSGEIENRISFVGSSGQSVVYMSERAVYITYSYNEDVVKFLSQFLKKKCQDLFPTWIIEKIEKLEKYEISQQAKILEFQIILEKYQNSLDENEKLRIQNELINRMSDYYNTEKRELEKSGILKIVLDGLEISAVGNVPGHPLNQFSLDEYRENLRIAVTVGEKIGWFGIGISGVASVNDIYILDKNLKILGQVLDLGLKEKIYSARFIEDNGYLVTFREIDPFYVLDLSNPREPKLKGELKISGYSSYLHPITEDKILGIGKEDWLVKISLFDVVQIGNPKELAKYIINEDWSDILNTHHAFLLDKKHEIFFLPGARNGYIFSYKDNKLVLNKVISDVFPKRAIYLDDYLYIIGDNKIVVLNELNWNKVKELEF